MDWVGVYLTSRHGNWRLRSAGHWTERHGEFIILALGKPSGAFYALPLFGGVVLYVAGQLLFKRRMHHVLSLPRLPDRRGPAAAAPSWDQGRWPDRHLIAQHGLDWP